MHHVHSHADAFADRNAFLQVALGALSLCRELADLAVALGPAAGGVRPVAAESDGFLDAALGIASLWRLAAQGFEQSLATPPSTPSPAQPGPSPTPPSLRSILA